MHIGSLKSMASSSCAAATVLEIYLWECLQTHAFGTVWPKGIGTFFPEGMGMYNFDRYCQILFHGDR